MINWEAEVIDRGPQGALHRVLFFLCQPSAPGWLDAAKFALRVSREDLGGEALVQSIANWLTKQNEGQLTTASLESPTTRMEWAAARKEELTLLHTQATFSQIRSIILRTLDDLVDHCFNIGEYSEAVTAILKSHDAIARAIHHPEYHCMAGKLAILSGDDSAVEHILSPLATRGISNEDMTSVFLMLGLKFIREANFSEAAKEFLKPTKLCSGASLPRNFDVIMTSNDLAVAGSLCVLAVGDRELIISALTGDSMVADNIRCSIEPQQMLAAAVAFRPGRSLRLAEEILKKSQLTDPHVGPKVTLFRSAIKISLLRNFCRPFSAIPIPRLVEHFESQMSSKEISAILYKHHIPGMKIDEQKNIFRRFPTSQQQNWFVASVSAEGNALCRQIEALDSKRGTT